MTAAEIIRAALEARTVADAERVQQAIADDVGERFERPVGDRWNNHGLLSTPGNPEYKLLELVTNAQDAVLERFAIKRFGSREAVPYETPHEAAVALLGDRPWQEVAAMVNIELYESDPPTRKTKRFTPVVIDPGCGIENAYLSKLILHLGTEHKDKARWQQGAFGLGGASTFRHAQAVVIVTRPHPDTNPTDDRITVAICQWQEHEKGKGLYYLVTSDWCDGGDLEARPWSAPESAFPDFDGGTHVALISYEIENYQYLTHGAEKSLERVLNTRLYKPVTPVRFANNLPKNEAERYFQGMQRQLEENPRKERRTISDTMPYRFNGSTAHLPITCHYFSSGKRDDPGAKRTVVAYNHAVLFTSNGQVHKHWSPQELRNRTELRQIHDRVLIVIELDELPIKMRTNLFPPDRSDLMDNEHARRLEMDLIEWLNDSEGELYELDRELLRQVLTSDSNGRPTINIARQIGRALKFKGGFALRGSSEGRGNGKRRRRRQVDLYPDPTTLEGPAHIEINQGATRGVRFHINAVDDFLNSGRGTLELVCNHPDIGDREITVGQLRKGSVRVTIASAEGAQLGDYTLTAALRGWQRAAGGIGPDLTWKTRITVVEPRDEEVRRRRRSNEKPDAEGELVGLAWRSEDDFDGWHSGVPGHVEEVEAKLLAEEAEDYKDLEGLGDTRIPTIFLNRDYAPLKRYEAARAKNLTAAGGTEDARDRYAVGAGLGLLLLDRDLKADSNGEGVAEDVELTAKQAAAQSALVMMPHYDHLARETGVDG